MTDDLVAFIKARLDADQNAAQQALDELKAHGGNEHLPDHKRLKFPFPEWLARCVHDTLQSPHRVLRAVEAKRRMLARHKRETDLWCDDDGQPLDVDLCMICAYGRSCSCCFDREYDGPFAKWPCPEVRDIASEWATHPDYRPEWAPLEDHKGAESAEAVLDSVAPIPPTDQDRPVGDGSRKDA